MEKVLLDGDFGLSRIIHGQMRMGSWNKSPEALLAMMEQLVDWGITTFDHADIYGNYTCEALLGKALRLGKGFREKIEIVTKCGIRLASNASPGCRIKHYDYSYDHIITSVDHSLRNFGTDRIDLLLLHRPAPFFDPDEASRAFDDLKKSGKVLHFGVSNFSPGQFEMLQTRTGEKLVTNQVELSPVCLEHFDNGNIDFFLRERIHPMAWSPMAGGKLLHPKDEKGIRVLSALQQVADELNLQPVEKVICAWLLKHPTRMMPVIGSGNLSHIRHAVDALQAEMSLEQWYIIYNASKGEELP